ncbi:unnamed protein product [Menidia menidia]|uniref:P2X purinoceptor n=1 Tax=Menidia menidia TaxID=238744 RepID=A0A8S4AVI1_9TELE|nr:unnamed protein product [Menidia menidia]
MRAAASARHYGSVLRGAAMSKTAAGFRSFLHYVFDYETPKTLVIPSIRVGFVFRFTQLLVVLYVVGYVCVVQKAYQETDSVISTVTTKVKGFAFTNTSDMDPRFWDVADFVIPAQALQLHPLINSPAHRSCRTGPQGGDDTFFVLTNLVMTPAQTQSRCPEVGVLLPNPSTTCKDDCDCVEGLNDPRGNGIRTGLCENYTATVKTCEVLSWCPLEVDYKLPARPLLAAAENFTVLIKNSITYPKFDFHRANILPHINSSYLRRCEFSHATDPDCPIFRLKHIVSEAGEDFQDMAIKVGRGRRSAAKMEAENRSETDALCVPKGGIIGILIDWSCDLDLWARMCFPKYSFRRLDNKNSTNNVAPGYNFRYAKYYKTPDGQEERTLMKAYGIRFNVIVFGTVRPEKIMRAGKFAVVPTIVNLGAALSFLSLVPVVADWFMLTCMKKKDLYSRQKVSYLIEEAETESKSMSTTYGTH